MQHRFEDAEQYARSFDDPARDVWQMPDRVIEALGVQPGQTVADVGAGTGYFTVRLAQSTGAKTVYAVDIEQSMVDYTRNRAETAELHNVVTVLAGSDRTNLPEPVDLALIVDTYHHIPDRVAYFTRLRASLRPSGRLAIIDFKKDSPTGPPVEFRFTPEQITGELERAGFTLTMQHDFLPRQMFLVYEASGPNVARAVEQSWVERAVHNFGELINTMWAEGELSFADDGTMVYCSAREDLAVAPGDPKDLYIATFNQDTGS